MSKFVYYNNNPYGKKEEDCVVRAITLASGLPYEEIENKLYMTGELLNCERLCVACYRMLIENVLKYQPMKRVQSLFVGEFADLFPEGTYLLRVDGHITVCKNGTIYDIWDCRNEIITDAWKIS